MEDAKELEAFDAYTRKMGVKGYHEIRSHRATRMPSAFRVSRVLLGFMLIAIAAGTINTNAATSPRRSAASPVSEPDSPRWIEPKADRGSRVDTGSEVDTAGRTADPERDGRQPATKKDLTPPAPRVEKAIAYALAQQGKPYRWAQAGPSGFDCSGLVLAAFKQIGIKLPHYTGAMIGYGRKVSKDQMQRGDIVFPSAGHVAIYLGGGKMVAASSGKGRVVIQKVYGFYAARRLV